MNKPCKSFVARTFTTSCYLFISSSTLIKIMGDEIRSSFLEDALFGLLFVVIAVTSVVYIFKLNREEHMQNRE